MQNKEKKDSKQIYTYKEILLALREQIIKNRILLKELNDLVTIERNAGSYNFHELLKNEKYDYKIRLTINEIEKRQSALKVLFNKLTKYKFARARINKFQIYDVANDNGEYNFKLSYTDRLEDDYFGSIKILDKDKFNSIFNELNNSKLSKINNQGIHLDDNLYIGISDYIEFFDGRNSVYYYDTIDSLNVDLYNKSFYDILNTEIDSSFLSAEAIDLINYSKYKDYDIEITKDKTKQKTKHKNYYKFNEKDKKIILEKK